MPVKMYRWKAMSCAYDEQASEIHDRRERAQRARAAAALATAHRILNVVAHGEQCQDEADERGLQRDEHAVADTRLQHRVEP